MTFDRTVLELILGIITIAALWIAYTYSRDKAYDTETIRSLKEQLDQASRNDHRDERGRYTGA